MKKLALIGGAALLTFGSFAYSAEESSGCGVGSEILAGRDTRGANIAAAILNTVFLNTVFMTTGGGILGCDPTQTVQRDELTEIFVAQNMDQLTNDTAKGSGDHLMVLAVLLGVPDSEVPHFTVLAQNEFDNLFSGGNNAASVIQSLQAAMSNDQKLSQYALN